jgi:LCP family protein required for cell wall assembly
MANGRPPGDGSSQLPRRRRDRVANAGGLEALGKQLESSSTAGGSGASGSSAAPGSSGSPEGADKVPNEAGLAALGAQVDAASGRGGRRGRGGGNGGRGGGGRGGGSGSVGAGNRPGRGNRRSGRRRWSVRRKIVVALSFVVIVALLIVGGGYIFLQRSIDGINKLHVNDEEAVQSGAPFTVLVIGSDSRVGENSKEFGSTAEVSGQRSDVVQLWRFTPSKKQVQVISIPRDTVVSMLGADVSEFGKYNRINTSFETGASQLVRTITANFGIPINHVVEIDFSGFQDAVNAVGGVYLDFNYPAKDTYSGLDVTTTGCQLLDGAQALGVARSRHYYYYENGEWRYDGTSDFGRIQRQDAFLRALIAAVKSKEANPIALARFAGTLHEGLEIDDGFRTSELIGLAETYHSFNGNDLVSQTLPTEDSSAFPDLGDVLVPEEPAAQQLLVNIFGSSLKTPTNPPPDANGNPEAPPAVTTTTAAAGTATTTTTTTPPPSFDPTPCTPS